MKTKLWLRVSEDEIMAQGLMVLDLWATVGGAGVKGMKGKNKDAHKANYNLMGELSKQFDWLIRIEWLIETDLET